MQKWTVYAHINKINGKAYVGITGQKPQWRWGKNGIGYKNQHFYNAIKKYEWKNFDHVVLESNLTLEEASEKEKFYIEKYNSYGSTGYNVAPGGYQNNISNFQRENMSKVKGIPVICVETKQIFPSADKAGEYFNVDGASIRYACTDQFRVSCNYHWMKYEDYIKNGFKETWNPSLKSVICLETEEAYESAPEASRKTNICNSSITKCCNKKAFTAGGLHWAYYEDYIKNEATVQKPESRGKKVQCVETGELFDSLHKAAKAYGVVAGTIRPACLNSNRTAANKHWRYV